jgi:hypothetical protein
MSEDRAAPPAKRESGKRIPVTAAIFLLALIPILLAPFPPSTDLPQHIAQVRLLHEALASPGGPYVIQWLGPNNLIYLFLVFLWAVLPVGLVARAALALVVLLWVAAIHGLGAGEKRAAASVVVASLLIFNQSLYWGFLNFLVGFPVFVLWFFLTARGKRRDSWGYWAALAGTALLLYESHALWFAAGVVWLVLIGVLKKTPFRAILWRLTALVPCGLISLMWYPRLSALRATAGFDVAAHWSPVFDRLASFLDAAFGGVRGPLGTLAFVFVLLWAGLSVWQNRDRLGRAVDRDLLAAALFFLTFVVAAPDKYMNTIFFSSRWFPPAMIFLLLALPAPAFRRLSARTAALAAAAVFFLTTAASWRTFETRELSGFSASLERLPASPRVLGLDLVKESDDFKDRPFLQLFAYAQVFRGGELNFSFAEHYSGLVAYRTKRDILWTAGLEWHAEKVKRSDFAFFDFVLANGEEKDHRALSSFAELSPVILSGRWRLYRVRR